MSGGNLARSPAAPEYAFVRDRRGEGLTWPEIGDLLGLAPKTAKARYGAPHDNAISRMAWAEHAAEAKALIALLLEESTPAAVLAVYLISIHRKLRELAPGSAEQVLAYARLGAAMTAAPSQPPTSELDDRPSWRKRPPLSQIADLVAAETGVDVALIQGRETTRTVAAARDQFAWAASAAGYTMAEIGAFAGGRDHSSMSMARKRHKRRAVAAEHGGA